MSEPKSQRMTAIERLGESERVLARCEATLKRAREKLEERAKEHARAIEDEREAVVAHDRARLEAIVARRAYETSTTEGPSALRDRSREVKTNGHGAT